MDSLSQECTASKHRYDQCFNAWFEGYLKPIVASHPVEEEEETEPEAEEEEDDDPSYLEPFDNDEDELLGDVEQADSSMDAPSSATAGAPHHHTHHQHHYPAWSLRNEDRHPDLWPFSTRPAGGRLSRATKTHVVVPPPLEAAEDPREATPDSIDDRSTDVPATVNSTTSSRTSKREAPAALPLTVSSPAEQRTEWAKAKKEEYDRNCGDLWTDYRECLQRAIDANHPLSALLNQARLENPIENAEAYDGGGYGAPGAQP